MRQKIKNKKSNRGKWKDMSEGEAWWSGHLRWWDDGDDDDDDADDEEGEGDDQEEKDHDDDDEEENVEE